MNSLQIYIAISIIVLAVVALAFFFASKNKKEKKLSNLAAFSFVFIIAGIIFGEDRMIGYSLMGIGVILAIVDAVKKQKNS